MATKTKGKTYLVLLVGLLVYQSREVFVHGWASSTSIMPSIEQKCNMCGGKYNQGDKALSWLVHIVFSSVQSLFRRAELRVISSLRSMLDGVVITGVQICLAWCTSCT